MSLRMGKMHRKPQMYRMYELTHRLNANHTSNKNAAALQRQSMWCIVGTFEEYAVVGEVDSAGQEPHLQQSTGNDECASRNKGWVVSEGCWVGGIL